jgi:hypothetical protein
MRIDANGVAYAEMGTDDSLIIPTAYSVGTRASTVYIVAKAPFTNEAYFFSVSSTPGSGGGGTEQSFTSAINVRMSSGRVASADVALSTTSPQVVSFRQPANGTVGDVQVALNDVDASMTYNNGTTLLDINPGAIIGFPAGIGVPKGANFYAAVLYYAEHDAATRTQVYNALVAECQL